MPRAALTTPDGLVTNVIVVPENPNALGGYTPPEGLELHELADDQPVGPGWRRTDGGWAPPPSEGLVVDRATIPADGNTAAMVTYTNTHDDAPAAVTFTVNGATSTVDLDAGEALLEVTATTPGPIEVTVDVLPDRVLTIHAEEA